MTQDEFQKMVDEATDRLAKAQETFVNEPGPVDDAAKLLADMVAMGDQIGLSTPSKVPAPSAPPGSGVLRKGPTNVGPFSFLFLNFAEKR